MDRRTEREEYGAEVRAVASGGELALFGVGDLGKKRSGEFGMWSAECGLGGQPSNG